MVQVRCYLKKDIMDNLHFFLILLFLLSNILVFFVQNPVYSLLFLILMFCETGVLLFIFNVEYQ